MLTKKDIDIFAGNPRILLQANEFICLRPHPHLRDYVSNYNITFPTKGLMPAGFTIMPCGCPTLTIEVDNKDIMVYLEGPTTKPYLVSSRTNQLKLMVTIEFKPAGLYALTGIPQRELADLSMPFEMVDLKLSKGLSEMIERAGSVFGLAAGFDRLLLENIHRADHPRLLLALQSIVGCEGNIAVKRLADDSYYSERQLNRIFKQHVGVGTKSFTRIIRINNAFRLLKKPNNSITLVSDMMGFHDLSHFVRDFKSVCGMTPQEYRTNMSDFYTNTQKF